MSSENLPGEKRRKALQSLGVELTEFGCHDWYFTEQKRVVLQVMTHDVSEIMSLLRGKGLDPSIEEVLLNVRVEFEMS